ncbi:MBL fold metallo-hydrolase [Verrucomicrobiales bacterium BCK34]|nr:MBL fold metallo-hydrolase [Verrucomicrobiales bacterium BCK34]
MSRFFAPSLLALGLALSLSSCSNRLAPYEDLLVGQPAGEIPGPTGNEVQITYLGTNGYVVKSKDSTIVIDPYLSRIPMREVILNAPVESSPSILREVARLAAIPKSIDGFLVTHGHFDHLFDVPAMQRQFGGVIIGSKTATLLSEASGVSRRSLLPSSPGKIYRVGKAKVRVLEAAHDRVLGRIPYPGLIGEPLPAAPSRPKDWRIGVPLAFLIEIEGQRIYVESGGIPDLMPPVSDVDLAIVGVAVKDSQKRYADAVRQLNPEIVIASHQDNFFLPLSKGFQFSTLSDFPRVIATHKAEALPGKLVAMDYFHTLTLK